MSVLRLGTKTVARCRQRILESLGGRASSTSTSDRPFKVLGLQQIAIGGLDKAPLNDLWVKMFGCEQIGQYTSEKENVDEDILLLGKGPTAVEVDLMQPLDAEKSPKVHIPALNHLGVWVDDIQVAVEWLSQQGVRFAPGGIRPGAAGHDITFIHPKGNEASPVSGCGVLIELVQAPPDVIAAFETIAKASK